MTRSFDVLVVGSGIAGLSFALKVAARGHRVAILTKKTSAETNTNRAQGGIAVVMSNTDDFESHVRDTLTAGDGLCDETVVREIVKDGPARVQELVDIGLKFSRDKEGNYDLGREGGHSRRRILHVKDMTGKAIEEALLRAVAREPRITLYEHCFAIDVVTTDKLRGKAGDSRDNRVCGLYALDVRSGRVSTFIAPALSCFPQAGRGRSISTRPTRISPRATELRWPTGPASRCGTWSSSSSIRPRSIRRRTFVF